MEYLLRSRKVWSIVNGETKRPEEDPGGREWDELDEEARQMIVMTVSDSQNCYLFEEQTSKGMWDKLKEAYQEVSVANKLRLKSTFNTYKKDPKHNVTQHVNRVKEMVQELKAVGVTIPDEDVILVLLDSLPEDYRMVRSSLKSQRNLTVEQVSARIKEEEHDLGLIPGKEEEKAFYGSGNHRNSSGVQCHQCGKFGHIKRFCKERRQGLLPSFKGKQYGNNSSKLRENEDISNKRCYQCNKVGHLKRDCKEAKASNALVADDCFEDEAYIGSSEAYISDTPWIIDSGATHHMCNEKSAFKEMKPLVVPKRIMLGNGDITFATHIGTVELELQTGNSFAIRVLQNVLFIPDVTKKLFSVSSCIEAGNNVVFNSGKATICNKDGYLVAQGKYLNGL
jgi:hypothetical protein